MSKRRWEEYDKRRDEGSKKTTHGNIWYAMPPIDEIYQLPDDIDMNVSGKQASHSNWLVPDALAEIQHYGPLPGDIEGGRQNCEHGTAQGGMWEGICHWMASKCLSMSTNAFIIFTTPGLSGVMEWIFILLLLPQHRY
jgi:hypothetical protein